MAIVLVGIFFLFTANSLSAADFPVKPITVILPFGPGGTTDAVTRTLDMNTKEVFGDNFVITYKPGAGSAIGSTALSREKPDGYTVGMLSMPHIALQSASGSGDFSLDSFDYFAMVVADVQVIVTPKGSPYTTFAQLSEAAKKNPNRITMGIPSPLSETYMAVLKMKQKTGLEFKIVTYQGGGEMNAALMGKHVDACMHNLGPASFESHNLNFLAISTSKPHPYAPEIPTFKSLGVDFTNFVERIFATPKGTDPAILQKLTSGFKKLCEADSFQKRIKKMRFLAKWMEGEELNHYMKKRWKDIVETYNALR